MTHQTIRTGPVLTHEEMLHNLITLTLREGVNLQPGQVLHLNYSPNELELGRLLVEKAYQLGAKYVDYRILDERNDAAQIRFASERFHYPDYFSVRGDELLDGGGARLSVLSQSVPDAYNGLDPQEIQRLRSAFSAKTKRLIEEGFSGMRLNWSVISPPSPAWAKVVFPELASEDAVARLWKLIFGMTFADRPNCLELWRDHSDRLERRAERLTALGIEKLHFEGPGTDLTVGISDQAVFLGGKKSTPSGIRFNPNIPTFETYTTPDWRRVNGVVRITKPSIVYGRPVLGLRLEFKDGEMKQATADENLDAYHSLISADPGASRLGEVALVGTDSPIHRSGLILHHTLYDENAACHIATGRAYPAAIRDHQKLSTTALTELGVNGSKVHHDVMISDEQVYVTALCRNGEKVPLLENGAWTEQIL